MKNLITIGVLAASTSILGMESNHQHMQVTLASVLLLDQVFAQQGIPQEPKKKNTLFRKEQQTRYPYPYKSKKGCTIKQPRR
jgi:hypothetical protein